MDQSNYLDKIANLIKRNPSITVREIAAELKFSDNKSIYYWLNKHNFAGINEFKRQVLSEEQPHSQSPSIRIEGVEHYLLTLPLYAWQSEQKKPLGEWYHFHHHPQSRGLYAIQVETDQFSPWFRQNDILVIAQGSSYAENNWVLVEIANELSIGKIINRQIVDPRTLANYPRDVVSIGTILNQTHYFPV